MENKSRRKIVAIASVGGHWVQLLRLRPAFNNADVVFVTTKESFKSMIEGETFYAVSDASRWNKLKLIKCFFDVFRILLKERPNLVITTGAAPGLMGIIVGKVLGIKTIWVDSIANVEELSMSGKIASKVATRVYTQWPDLQKGKIIFEGSVIS